jgi:Ser/Thr protein kinase RdoA (MazF antagonist)
MKQEELLACLRQYGVSSVSTWEEIDTSLGDDYRLNVIVDKKYVLRINGDVMTEQRLASIDRLSERYRSIGLQAPRLYRNRDGQYLSAWGGRVCYLSDYIDLPTERECECDHEQVRKEILQSVGRLSRQYSNEDLSDVYSMWSIIDLAPLDRDKDEKQVNLELLADTLREMREEELAEQVVSFNERARQRIRAVYQRLPRCVIQGDLNPSNILIRDGHFAGLIDFNMAGTEVNVNHFCAETNGWIMEAPFETQSAAELYRNWRAEQDKDLNVILQEYTLNGDERRILRDYRSIALISQYPNVMAYLEFLEKDREKCVQLLRCILERG